MSFDELKEREQAEGLCSIPVSDMGGEANAEKTPPKALPFGGKRGRGERTSYAKMVRGECLDCKCGSWSDIRSCSLYWCAYWKYRQSKTDIHKAVISGQIDSLESAKDRKEAERIAKLVKKNQDDVIEKAKKLCPGASGSAEKAFSTRSMANATKLYCLQCTNFQPSEIRECSIDRCELHSARPYGGIKSKKRKAKRGG